MAQSRLQVGAPPKCGARVVVVADMSAAVEPVLPARREGRWMYPPRPLVVGRGRGRAAGSQPFMADKDVRHYVAARTQIRKRRQQLEARRAGIPQPRPAAWE